MDMDVIRGLNKQYIGDGVYVEDREHAIRLTTNNLLIRLTTNNGLGVTNEIYLDDYVMRALIEYWKKARKVGDGKL